MNAFKNIQRFDISFNAIEIIMADRPDHSTWFIVFLTARRLNHRINHQSAGVENVENQLKDFVLLRKVSLAPILEGNLIDNTTQFNVIIFK